MVYETLFDFYLFFSLFSINLNLEVLSCTVASEGKVKSVSLLFRKPSLA